MANNYRSTSVFLPAATPDLTNSPTAYAEGEIGQVHPWNSRLYRRVKLDSGATAATPAGVVAANQVAYWKDKNAGIVTNDSRFAVGGQTSNAWRNFAAGIFRTAVTAGYICDILTFGTGISVKSSGTGDVGQTAIAGSSTSAADVDPVAVGTASTYRVIGYMTASPDGGNVTVDVNIPDINGAL